MWLTLDKCASELGILDNFLCLGDNIFVACVVIRLTNINMNKLIPRINRTLTIINSWTMVEVDVHLDAIFLLVVINHITNIFETKGLNFSVTDLYEDGRVEFLSRAGNRNQRLLIVDIKCAYCKILSPGPLIQMTCPKCVCPDL